jgi:DNA repair exonuclease SbcCD ATPase subunit
MKIKKIEWKNFASYGNRKQTLEFPQDACLFQVVGNNGVGKTTISQVISFCLYGKVEGKKLGDIPNRINGHTWTRIEFESGNKSIAVERGLDPSIFNLYIDGVLYDQAGNRNIQDYLSDDLIGIPYYVFNNTISLSINDFKSFIKMSPQDKRAIVDKIFGFHILNQMREALKSESKKIKEELDMLTGGLESTKKSIDKSNSEIENLLSQIEKESKDKINDLNEDLEKFKNLMGLHSERVNGFLKEERDLLNLISSTNRSLIEARTKCSDLERRLKLYESEKCPTCESSLKTDFHNSIKSELLSDKEKESKNFSELDETLKKMKESESEFSRTKFDLNSKGNKIQMKINEIIREIEKTQSKDSDSQISSLKRILENLNSDKDKMESDVLKIEEKNLWVKKLDDILGEKGVKQMAIKTILPSLNSEIINLMRDMNLDYQVVFDEEFKASLYHMGAEIPTATLSTGEMKKVDFVVLISIMKLMKLKFSTINLLFLDELFSSVDPEGIHLILKILKKNSKDMGLNIFVINHAPMPHEIFDWRLEVSKTNNFSTISIEKF